MKHDWFFYTKKLDDLLVNEIVKQSTAEALMDGRIGAESYEDQKLNKTIRNSQVAFLNKYQHKAIYDIVYDLGVEANNQAYGFDVNSLETCQFTLYDSSIKGHYDWHTDTPWVTDNMFHRKISVVIQLSDPNDYEGGVLEIKDAKLNEEQKEAMMQKGSVITFPSFAEHRVTPVTKGKRMSLIGWLLGAKFR